MLAFVCRGRRAAPAACSRCPRWDTSREGKVRGLRHNELSDAGVELSCSPRIRTERSVRAVRRTRRAAGRPIAQQRSSKTSVAQVGQEAGYTGGPLIHLFGPKEGPVRAVVDRASRHFDGDQLEAAVQGLRGLSALCAQADAYLNERRVREEGRHTLYVLMGESLGRVPEIGPVVAHLSWGFRPRSRAWILEGVARAEIRAHVDADAEAALFLGMLRGAGAQWLAEP
jgi:hypothetical protein